MFNSQCSSGKNQSEKGQRNSGPRIEVSDEQPPGTVYLNRKYDLMCAIPLCGLWTADCGLSLPILTTILSTHYYFTNK